MGFFHSSFILDSFIFYFLLKACDLTRFEWTRNSLFFCAAFSFQCKKKVDWRANFCFWFRFILFYFAICVYNHFSKQRRNTFAGNSKHLLNWSTTTKPYKKLIIFRRVKLMFYWEHHIKRSYLNLRHSSRDTHIKIGYIPIFHVVIDERNSKDIVNQICQFIKCIYIVWHFSFLQIFNGSIFRSKWHIKKEKKKEQLYAISIYFEYRL